MSYSPRNIKADLSAMLDKLVIVRLTSNRTYTGILNSYETTPFLISLTNAKDNENNVFYRVLINGEYVSEILLKSSPLFEPREFASFLEKALGLRSTDIKVYDEAGVVVVLDKIKVTENGVEGSGPMAQKVYDVFNDYIKRKKEGK
jgi:hypothetical protein